MHKFYLIISVILMFLLAYLWNHQIKLNPDNLFNHKDPIESMHAVHIYNYDQNGRLKHYTSTNSWKFFPRHKISFLRQPMVKIYRSNDDYYKISADAGTILHQARNYKIDIIKLSKKVVLQQKHSSAISPSGFNLSTDYLEFNPDLELITTDKQVVVYQPGLSIKGTGLQANLKTQQIELQHDVTTEYSKDFENNQHEQ